MRSYQLHISFKNDAEIQIGKLGKFKFLKGTYIYTGSAKKNIDARINRHKSQDKKLRWHVDYFLNHENTQIFKTEKFDAEECFLNQRVKGEILISGFGSSDCKNGCGSHLKYLG